MPSLRNRSSHFVAVFAGGLLGCLAVATLPAIVVSETSTLTCTVVDASTRQPLPARVYLTNADGKRLLVKSRGGVEAAYVKQRNESSVEVHTSVSAHPFSAQLPPGTYTLEVERGKEYLPQKQIIKLGQQPEIREIRLKRWVNLAEQGWYSGETHVHRNVSELPVLQLAEDLNVAFPLTAWVTDSLATPATHNKNREEVPPAKLVRIDDTHVFWPVNTEYEIFSVRGKRHTLGAVFILNHQSPLKLPAPPVAPIATEARRQGAFLELDKHNWPWSMMLVPQMEVELFELANNHMWRTGFLFSDWYPEFVGAHMNVEMVDGRFTERGWIQFGLENYYALLNCGFPLKPTAGTASGVHPVPLGFGRVYVKLKGGFNYAKWVKGLLNGDSFVTTGPMLNVDIQQRANQILVTGKLSSLEQPTSLEIIVNGHVAQAIPLRSPNQGKLGAYRVPIKAELPLGMTCWVAVRAFCETSEGRVRFAHTAPSHFHVADKPLRPSKQQRDYLTRRVANEIARNQTVLSEEALDEFRRALRKYQSIPVQ